MFTFITFKYTQYYTGMYTIPQNAYTHTFDRGEQEGMRHDNKLEMSLKHLT